MRIIEDDLRIDVVSRATPGADYSVTVRHLPSGLVGSASDRSQIAAREAAMADLEQQMAATTSTGGT